MRCALLLVTHPAIGSAMLTAARTVLAGNLPLAVSVLEVPWGSDPHAAVEHAVSIADRLDGGGGVLILTDLYGASPSNLAALLAAARPDTRRIAGLSLPMLLRVLNYPDLDLAAMTRCAAEAAYSGAIVDNA